MVENPNSLLNEIYRTGGGAIADTVDGLTGLGAAGVNLLLRGSPVQGTSFGPQVPQPWATGNKILRSAIPFATPGTFGGSASGVVRSVPPVLRSAPAVVKEAQVMTKNGMSRRSFLGVQDVVNKYGKPTPPEATPSRTHPAIQGVVEKYSAATQPVDRRQVSKGIAATAAVAPIAGKIVEAIPAARAAAPKAVKAVRAISPMRIRALLDKATEWDPPEPDSPFNTTYKTIAGVHDKLAKTDPRHKVAADAWAEVRRIEQKIIHDDVDLPDAPPGDDTWEQSSALMKHYEAGSEALQDAHDQAFAKAYQLTHDLFPLPKVELDPTFAAKAEEVLKQREALGFVNLSDDVASAKWRGYNKQHTDLVRKEAKRLATTEGNILSLLEKARLKR